MTKVFKRFLYVEEKMMSSLEKRKKNPNQNDFFFVFDQNNSNTKTTK